jgi:putative lipoic acid-binding regulatory protein
VGSGIYHNGDTNTNMTFGTDIITIAAGGSAEITVNTTGVRLGDTGNGYFQPVSGGYGSIQIDQGAHNGWEGYSIGGRVVFMHNNSTSSGIYNDVDDEWMFYGVHNSYTRMYYNGTHKVETTSSGITVVGDVNSSSDIRYKKNIETIDNALDKVQSLRGVTFDWDNDAFTADESTKKPNFTARATGVIAQDVEKVLPEAVRENEDGFKNVSYGNMVGLLIEAIKEQQEQIDMLTHKIDKMENL